MAWHCTEGHDNHPTQQSAVDCEQAAQTRYIEQLAKENKDKPRKTEGPAWRKKK